MVQINNLTFFKIPLKKFKKLAAAILGKEKNPDIDLSITFLGKKEMARLNRKYLKRKGATDVLSFFSLPSESFWPEKYAGSSEVAICPAKIIENARKFKCRPEKEMLRVFIHGLLHILGYDHKNLREKKTMLKKEDKYFPLS